MKIKTKINIFNSYKRKAKSPRIESNIEIDNGICYSEQSEESDFETTN